MRRDVKNKSCKYWKRVWVYTWSWLEWGKNKLNNPWGGQWVLTFSDGSGVLEWKWDKAGALYAWTLKLNWKNEIKITKAYYDGTPTKFFSFEWSMNINWANCGVEVGKDFKINKVKYNNSSVQLDYDSNGEVYLKSSKGKLKLWSWIKGEVAVYWIAKSVDIVKNSGYVLDYFESDNGEALQADYEDKVWDTNLLRNCQSKFWVDAYSLAAWLNACRHTDFGI